MDFERRRNADEPPDPSTPSGLYAWSSSKWNAARSSRWAIEGEDTCPKSDGIEQRVEQVRLEHQSLSVKFESLSFVRDSLAIADNSHTVISEVQTLINESQRFIDEP